jgi:ribosomal protein S18 acetylase RimI-like enzyme
MVPVVEVCVIDAIFVQPDFGKLPIGSKLIEALLGYCQAEGIDTGRTLVSRGNKELRALVERHGFQRSRITTFDRTFES